MPIKKPGYHESSAGLNRFLATGMLVFLDTDHQSSFLSSSKPFGRHRVDSCGFSGVRKTKFLQAIVLQFRFFNNLFCCSGSTKRQIFNAHCNRMHAHLRVINSAEVLQLKVYIDDLFIKCFTGLQNSCNSYWCKPLLNEKLSLRFR